MFLFLYICEKKNTHYFPKWKGVKTRELQAREEEKEGEKRFL